VGRTRDRRVAIAGLAAAVTALVLAAVAFGAVGDLTPIGCIDDEDSGPDTCAATGDGLDRPEAVAVSPDGKSVYTVSSDDEAIARFQRNLSTGALTYKGCIDGTFSPSNCATTIPGNFLINAVDVAVSPDGAAVYVISRFGDSGIFHFERNTTNGALTFRNCVGDDDNPACDKNMAGIDDPTGVAISPNGDDVYVADFGADAIAHLRVNTTNGNLNPKECVIETDASPSDPCGDNTPGLAAADSVAVSPDGNSVYAVGAFSDAIVRFDRNLGNGTIHPMSCVQDPSVAFETCAKEQIGMARPEGVVVSPEGNSVYVVAHDDSTLVRFDRSPAGALKPQGCFVDNEFPTVPCGDSPKGLTGAHDVAISDDGRSLYVASSSESAVAELDRDPATGALTPRRCIKDVEATADFATCNQSTAGLGGASDVAVSPDDESVYATGGFPDNAVVAFSREQAP
jgi:DNA-binding beta-propeller fold protein YncE